jgi:hypothetical protein
MKQLLLALLVTTTFSITASAQFVARLEVKEPIPGVCNNKEVYNMLPMFKGQEEAKCPMSKDDILTKLNSEVIYLQDSPEYTDKGMIGLIINCKGEVVQCKMDNKTKDPLLDEQIEKVFRALGEWKAGKLNGKKVDTSRLFSFQIVNGKFVWG